MRSRIVNVRLDPDRLRKVRALREKGVALSDLVRDAIDEKYETLGEAGRSRDAAALVRSLLERYPDPLDLPDRNYDVHDRREAREAIHRRLSSKRSE